MKIKRSDDFKDQSFQTAFKSYFNEFELEVEDWDDLFTYMSSEGGNYAYLLLEDEDCLGFILARNDTFNHWFLEQKFGFIREFWVKPELRGQKLGHQLISVLEENLIKEGLKKVYLTAAGSTEFYLKRGYQFEPSIKANNENEVLGKSL